MIICEKLNNKKNSSYPYQNIDVGPEKWSCQAQQDPSLYKLYLSLCYIGISLVNFLEVTELVRIWRIDDVGQFRGLVVNEVRESDKLYPLK